jgi:hypothetical protein
VHRFSAAEIEAHLQAVLASAAFKSSRRSQAFLEYVVRGVLEGREESIKERNIAVEVFGRPADYNTSEDSFVRVKAGEVRRRLAKYYASAPDGDTLRFELPLGSYVPEFVPSQPRAARGSRRWPLVLIGGIIVAAVVFMLYTRRKPALEEFWSPILKSPEPLILCLPLLSSYVAVDERSAREYGTPVPEILMPSGQRGYLAPTHHRVGFGAALGAIRFASLCTRMGKPYTVKGGEDFTFADLRNQPAVLFGAFSSKWTLEMNNEYRFKLVRTGDYHIVDARDPSRQWRAAPGQSYGNPAEDYAVATRVFDSKSGRLVIIAAGLSSFGTQAAAEFLTEPARLEELARRAPGPLSRVAFQAVLHTRVIGNTPGPPKLVDVHFW